MIAPGNWNFYFLFLTLYCQTDVMIHKLSPECEGDWYFARLLMDHTVGLHHSQHVAYLSGSEQVRIGLRYVIEIPGGSFPDQGFINTSPLRVLLIIMRTIVLPPEVFELQMRILLWSLVIRKKIKKGKLGIIIFFPAAEKWWVINYISFSIISYARGLSTASQLDAVDTELLVGNNNISVNIIRLGLSKSL